MAGLGEEDEDDGVAKKEDEAGTEEEGGKAMEDVTGEAGGGREAGRGPGEEEDGGERLHAPEEALHLLETAVAPHRIHGVNRRSHGEDAVRSGGKWGDLDASRLREPRTGVGVR